MQLTSNCPPSPGQLACCVWSPQPLSAGSHLAQLVTSLSRHGQVVRIRTWSGGPSQTTGSLFTAVVAWLGGNEAQTLLGTKTGAREVTSQPHAWSIHRQSPSLRFTKPIFPSGRLETSFRKGSWRFPLAAGLPRVFTKLSSARAGGLVWPWRGCCRVVCVYETLRVQGDGEAGPVGTSSYPALFIHSTYHSL